MPSKRPDDIMSGHQNTMAGDGAFVDDLLQYQFSTWPVDGAARPLSSSWAAVAEIGDGNRAHPHELLMKVFR